MLRPQILACLPLEMFLLRELALSLGIDPARELDSLETAILAGAPLPPAMRRAVERDWNVRVREIYGSNETLFLGADCEKGRLHLETSLFVAEVLDPDTLAPAPKGTPGIFTLTHLGTKAMPLVRYLTRDVIRVLDCDCGRPEPAVQLLGRQDDVAAYDGRRLYTNDVLEAGYGIAEAVGSHVFFTVLRSPGVLFRVELDDPRTGVDPRAVARAAEALGVPVEAEAVRRGDLLDPGALVRTPKVYKPAQIADWRGAGRKPLTIMEALLAWPTFDLRTSVRVLARVLRTNRRRRQLLRAEPRDAAAAAPAVQPIRSTVYR
jgi:phenylacetate-CoA ligase